MKKKVLIVFGGKSGEHEVSVRSAQSIEKFIDKDKFEPHVVGVTPEGVWNFGKEVKQISQDLKVIAPTDKVSLPTKPGSKELTISNEKGVEQVQFDVIFPIIHGTNGEDGKLQGMLEMANLPYVGAGVIGSALAMDKVLQKQLCQSQGIPQTEFEWFWKHEWQSNADTILDTIEKKFGYPVFAKPANLGSSVGISKAKNREELSQAIEEALEYDTKGLVEKAVLHIIEVEVSVLGNHHPEASVCGSIEPNTEFYDYETKYITDDIKAKIPADIPQHVSEKIRKTAIDAYKLLNCKGMARVDFFYQADTEEYFLNELNTLPGFTSISMYPKLWEASGLSYTDLITKLIELAQEDWEEKQQLKHSYK